MSSQLGQLFKTDKLTIDGYWWLHYNKVSSFALDGDGHKDGLGQSLDHRLRVRPRILLSKNVDVYANLDVLAGQVWGDTSTAAADEQLSPRDRKGFTSRSAMRELYLEWRSVAGVLRVGQVASQWGMGLVANDGEDRADNFDDTWNGDRTERVQFTFRPATWWKDPDEWGKHLTLSIAGDLVFRDDHASLVDGDRAWQVVGAAWWDGPVTSGWDTFTGLYVAWRHQTYDDGDRLEAAVVDLYTKHVVPLGKAGARLVLQGEGVMTTGRTDVVTSSRIPDGMDLMQWGMAFRAGVDVPSSGVFPSLEVGVANGDKDTGDATGRSFTFDPDYQVGMILFRQVLGRMSAWAVERMRNPQDYGKNEVPHGYEQALTNGAVTNAVYVYPRLRWSPMKGLDIRLAFLWARALADVTDPYVSAVEAAGYPQYGYRKGQPSTDLGWEIDGSIAYRSPNFWGPFNVALGAQFGWCKPGAAFDDAKGDSLGGIWEARVGAELAF